MDQPFINRGGFGPHGWPGSRQSPPPGCCLSLPDCGAEGIAAGAALGGVTRGGPGHRRAMERTRGMGIQMVSFGEAKSVIEPRKIWRIRVDIDDL